jgi:hypothetical protein
VVVVKAMPPRFKVVSESIADAQENPSCAPPYLISSHRGNDRTDVDEDED